MGLDVRLPEELSTRLILITQAVAGFWENHRYYSHLTYQGIAHSLKVEEIAKEIAGELPVDKQLNRYEIFILFAACRLYEVGLQYPVWLDSKDIIESIGNNFDLSYSIYLRKHLLSEKLINYSISNQSSNLKLGFHGQSDDFMPFIAKVCRFCCEESLEEISLVDDYYDRKKIRLKLLVGILRLADQLYISSQRINSEKITSPTIPINIKARLAIYQFTQVLPIQDGIIKFRYIIPAFLKKEIAIFNKTIEKEFRTDNNSNIRFLAENYGLRLWTSSSYEVCESEHLTQVIFDTELMEYLKMGVSIPDKADILIVTVTKIETLSVMENFLKPNEKYHRDFRGDKTYYFLGNIAGSNVFLVQSEMGTMSVGGSMDTVLEGINVLEPGAIIMTGIAFGVNEGKQKIGDILVSTRLLPYELQKIGTSPDGYSLKIPRSDRPHASAKLIDRFRAGSFDWSSSDVRFGLLLSGEKLIDNSSFRDQLVALEPEAIGGEMEGTGVYLAANKKKVDWIIVKAICDWADGNKSSELESRQLLASNNSARFVFHVIQQGGM